MLPHVRALPPSPLALCLVPSPRSRGLGLHVGQGTGHDAGHGAAAGQVICQSSIFIAWDCLGPTKHDHHEGEAETSLGSGFAITGSVSALREQRGQTCHDMLLTNVGLRRNRLLTNVVHGDLLVHAQSVWQQHPLPFTCVTYVTCIIHFSASLSTFNNCFSSICA